MEKIKKKCGLIIAVTVVLMIGVGILAYSALSKRTSLFPNRDKKVESISVYVFKPEDDVLYQKDIVEQNDIEYVLDVLAAVDYNSTKKAESDYQGTWMLAFKFRYVDSASNVHITVVGEDKILVGHDWDEMYEGIFPNVDEFWDTLDAPIREGSWDQIA